MLIEKNDMHRIDIVAALHKKGVTVKTLSIQAGLAPTTLSNALNRPWPKGERIIAEALDVQPHDIWPSRYANEVI
ncbi:MULTISPECIES: helix-turn-helix domain-containing protein [Vibrionaceae]|uniref:Transcriptional regulator, Nlp family n=1 Tax=Enterovibrio nigricans DSM 22720 TaxID=1121868 RepID=A0A1T4VPC4_9GAMM|nr:MULTISPECIES: helix-turn-helix transcriptional regulator [Vibrionaceae]MBE8578609.1 helix-turn-helix domain-containing protein [Vibrio sp. OPT18]PKF49616.1 transcriptional regulator [Enterovibrio nigricans]SKA66371.1 transcriptional regulator, Nlp family [Enterovibrio nigricans DSM 22720]